MPDVEFPNPRKLKRARAVALIEALNLYPDQTKVQLAREAYHAGWLDAEAALAEAQVAARVAVITCGDQLAKGIVCLKEVDHDTEHYAVLHGFAPATAIRWTNHKLDGKLSAP